MAKNIAVLYHNNCNDGFGGAWAARKKFGDKAEYIGVIHHESPPSGLNGKEVYIIDFSYPADETRKLLKKTKSLTILDHHVNMKNVVESVPYHVYDIDHSGEILAWNYFFPDKDVPLFLQYVEDGDLWRFELPESKHFYAFSLTMPFDFMEWDKMVDEFEDEKKRKIYLAEGAKILEYQENMIEELMGSAEESTLDGHKALAVNSSVLASQLGNAIVERGYDIGIVWFYMNEDTIRVSLRSDKDGNVDVGKIAEKYGGGGHKSSAGFIINQEPSLPWQTE